MTEEFPLTLAAVKRTDEHQNGDQWAIGDALLAECGPPRESSARDGSYALLQEVAKYLLSEGYEEYSLSTLRQLRDTSFFFPAAKRGAKLAWGVYRTAYAPEYLEAIIAGAPKGTKITQTYIEGIRTTQIEKARRERERQAQKAIEAREKAEAEEVEARKKVREAKEAEARKAAEEEAQKAARKTEKAKQKEQEVRVAPRPKVTPPKPEEVPQLVAEMTFMANASRSVVLARQAVKDLQSCLDQLSPKGAKALTSAALEAANAWSDAAHTIRSEVRGQQEGHLSVVGE